MAGKRIDDLDSYGSYDLDKMRADIYEVSKNSGTSVSPIYASDGSRKIRLDDLAAKIGLIFDAGGKYLLLSGGEMTGDISFANVGDGLHWGSGNIRDTGDGLSINASGSGGGQAIQINSNRIGIFDCNSQGVVLDSFGININDNFGDQINLSSTGILLQGSDLSFSTSGNFKFNGPSITANTVPYIDSVKNLVSSSVTPTELGYLSGVTSGIQNQLNNINSGLSWKQSVRVATTGNITLSGTQTIDGISVVVGDRVLVKNQSTASGNGIYVVSSGSWARSTDASTGTRGSNGLLGATVTVEEGSISADTIYICSTDAPITIGSTSISFVRSSATTYTGSNGITLTGNNFTLDNSYFSGDATVSGGVISIGSGKVTNSMLAGSIAYSKLVLTGSILNADIAGSISDGKLASSYIYADGTRALTGAWYNTQNASFSNLGIGTGSTVPASILQTVNTSTTSLRGVVLGQYNTGTEGSRIFLRKSRNTFASPSTIVTGDILGNIFFSGHEGTAFNDSASIMVTSVGTIGTNRVPSKMDFRTSTDSASSVLTTALTLDELQRAIFASDVLFSSAKGIKDSNGVYLLQFPTTVTSAVNWASISNSITGSAITIGAATGSSDTNVPVNFQSKGGGIVTLKTGDGAASISMSTAFGGMSYVGLSQSYNGSSTSTTVFSFGNGSVATGYTAVSMTAGSQTATSGTGIGFAFNRSISPTSGSANFIYSTANPSINQTGGANGSITLWEANPTMTSVIGTIYGFRSRIVSGPTGGGVSWNVFADGTANNSLVGNTVIGSTTAATSKLTVTGSFGTTGVTVTANTTLDSTNRVVEVDASGGSVTITLPTAVGISWREYIIKKIDSSINTVTVATTSSQTIDGITTKVLSIQYASVDVYSTGTNWSIH